MGQRSARLLVAALVAVTFGCSGGSSAVPEQVAAYADQLDERLAHVGDEVAAWLEDAEREPAELTTLAGEVRTTAFEAAEDLPEVDTIASETFEVDGGTVDGGLVADRLQAARAEAGRLADELERVGGLGQLEPAVLVALDDAWTAARGAASQLRGALTGADS